MADDALMPIKTGHRGTSGAAAKSRVINLPSDAAIHPKSEPRWPRGLYEWIWDNARWIAALASSIIAAYAFFALTGSDPLDFMELVLALAVGGTISAAASFKVMRGEAKNERQATAERQMSETRM